MLAVMRKRMQQLSKMLGPAVHCGKDTTHNTLETICNARAWPQQCSGRAVQTDPTFLRYASAITEQKKCWELLANNVVSFFMGLKKFDDIQKKYQMTNLFSLLG